MADVDDKPVEENEEQPSEDEKDALNSISDTKGDVTENQQPEEPTIDETGQEDDEQKGKPEEKPEDKSEAKKTPSAEDEPEVPEEKPKPVELEPEKDETGVYEEPKVEDPGEFKPSDYSFSVQTTDGRMHKLSTPEDVDAFAATLDENPESITASQFSIFNRKAALMEQGIATDKKDFETSKEQFEAEKSVKETRDKSLAQWNNEINYLQDSGELPEISEASNKANWSDPEVAKDPAVAARLGLLKWMNDENTKRMGAGLEPMTSLLDAHNAMQLEKLRSHNVDEKKTETEERRKRGARVGGNAPFSPEGTPKGSIVGTGGTLSDLVTEYMENQ